MKDHHHKSGFRNPGIERTVAPFWKVLWWLITRDRLHFDGRETPAASYPAEPPPPGDVRIFYVGHATLLIETAGLRILTDPVFSNRCSPIPTSGTVRYRAPGLQLDALPDIDVVLITHNHYDHLDAPTIKALGNKPQYIVPQGLGAWFRRRGITRVHELDWWEQATYGPAAITAVPCQHWSKRTPFDAMKSLWCGFTITTEHTNVLFIGDSGYCNWFRTIGEELGPFHIAALPIGGYQPADIMAKVHMTPEEAFQAFLDVGARVLVPTHYNTFHLTDEPIGDASRRLYRAWRHAGLDTEGLWMLGPGQYRSLEDIVHIPTVRAVGTRIAKGPEAVPRTLPDPEDAITDWGIAICPHAGEMVDLEIIGHRGNVFTGDGGQTPTIDAVRCSAYGDFEECQGVMCPLRDPAFLRTHGIDSAPGAHGSSEPFIEFEMPPSATWWRDELCLARLVEGPGPEPADNPG